MAFQTLLNTMLQSVPGALAAMFLDYEGEAVEVSGRTLTIDQMKIVGAYQGIYLTQIRRITDELAIGAADHFKLDFENFRIFTAALKDGYYLVLLAGYDTNEGLAWRAVDVCRDALLSEL